MYIIYTSCVCTCTYLYVYVCVYVCVSVYINSLFLLKIMFTVLHILFIDLTIYPKDYCIAFCKSTVFLLTAYLDF